MKALKQKLSDNNDLAKEFCKEILGEERFNKIPEDQIDSYIKAFIEGLSTLA